MQPDRPRSLPQRIGDLGRTIRHVAPDVVVSVNGRPLLASFAARIASRRAVPIIAISHSTLLRTRWEEVLQLAYTPLFNRVEGVVFISHNQRGFWMKRGFAPRDAVTILNGIDLDRFSPAVRAEFREATRARLNLAPDDYVIGLCAVMRPEKNHLQIVEAVSWLRQQGVPAKALLVGDGPMRGTIEERVRALGLSDAVVLAGMHQDVRPLTAAFDVGCLCSVSIETLSLAALEVMAMGIPMVLSELGGASEIVDGTNGRLFPVGSDAGLREALLSLRDPATLGRAGEAARRTAVARFDRKDMIDAYLKHFLRFALRD